ncbi:hypothetical protein GCM10011504_28880 [Siccirubricoccus deserti]|nr:hypothetical protein GCM10011504_28880 [Siccirubricoccus deserti]
MIGRAAGIRMTAMPCAAGRKRWPKSHRAGGLQPHRFSAGMAQHRGSRVRLITVTNGKHFPLAPELPPIGC